MKILKKKKVFHHTNLFQTYSQHWLEVKDYTWQAQFNPENQMFNSFVLGGETAPCVATPITLCQIIFVEHLHRCPR
jgi:hypothetical protein